MSDPKPARFAYLTDPEPKVCILNVQSDADGDALHSYMLNRDQIFRLNKETADFLLKAYQ